MTKIPPAYEKALRHLNWYYHEPVIRLFLTDEKRTIIPRVYRLYGGKDAFKMIKGKLHVYGREVIVDAGRKKAILNREEERYGGERKAHHRVASKYFGISRSDINTFFSGSERRQLKMKKQKASVLNRFLHATRPGTIQIDLTFYRGAKIAVFGAIDVFSRWCYYERVPSKRADLVVRAMKTFVTKFNSLGPHKVYHVQSDKGVEFQAEFSSYMKKNHIHYDAQAKSRKMIEALNGTMRRYIERVGWDTIKELDELIMKFQYDYNESIHGSTRKVPNELVVLSGDERKQQSSQSHREGKARAKKAKGFNLAILKAGDKVRIYDPKRREIKSDQKKELKGKVKLSEKDFVKQYTSHHMGNDPHWTKEVFIVERVLIGKRGSKRYLIEGKKGGFLREELQRVAPVTKVDPRKKKKKDAKKAQDKLDERKPPAFRTVKYVSFFVYFKVSGEKKDRRGLLIGGHRDYALILSRQQILIRSKPEIVKFTNDRIGAKKGGLWKDSESKKIVKDLLEKHNDQVIEAKAHIDDYLGGKTNTLLQPVKPAKQKDDPEEKAAVPPKIGRKLKVYEEDGKQVMDGYFHILLEYRNHFLVRSDDDGSLMFIEESEIHKWFDDVLPKKTLAKYMKEYAPYIKDQKRELDKALKDT